MPTELRARWLSGRDLAAERVRRGLRALDVAAAMNVSRQRITNIEASQSVRPELARRYTRALKSASPQQSSDRLPG